MNQPKTCVEYVMENLTEKEKCSLRNVLNNSTFLRDKSKARKGDLIVFAHGFHVGFGKIGEYLDVTTNECSDGSIFSRELSLYDDRLKLVILNPRIKKGCELFETDRVISKHFSE